MSNKNPLLLPFGQYPIALLDFLWVITIYVSSAFILAAIIDGFVLPPFNLEYNLKTSSLVLTVEILFQFALQGFIAIFLCVTLQNIPSPVQGILGYESHNGLGVLLRNPAIINIILFTLSKSLRGKLFILFGRIDKNQGIKEEVV